MKLGTIQNCLGVIKEWISQTKFGIRNWENFRKAKEELEDVAGQKQ